MNSIYLIANWKMNPESAAKAQGLSEEIAQRINQEDKAEVVLCPPFVYVPEMARALNSGTLRLGGQNCFWEQQGAFTGEVSPAMLQELGCSYVIVGHSERKNYLGETYEMINRKVKAAMAAGLRPVVCIGEKKRGEGEHELALQIRQVLQGIPVEQARGLILAYEPEWAISSNKDAVAAEPQDAARSIAYMRQVAKEMLGQDVPILYGGSTNSGNVRSFLDAGAQGALVGSASLDANEFVSLVRNAVS